MRDQPRSGRIRAGPYSARSPYDEDAVLEHWQRPGERSSTDDDNPLSSANGTPGKKGMRIAQVAPLAESVPPKLYGGTERVVSWLTEELVRQGHQVTLFASGDSETSAELVPGTPRGLRLAGIRDHTASLLVMLDDVRRKASHFDIIHFHVDLLQFPMFRELTDRSVTTLHGRLDLPDFHPVYRVFRNT